MDTSWQTLSNEVLWLIFAAVEKNSDLVQLQQVCKHWSYLAYRRLYHTACIDQTPFLKPYAQTLEHSTYQPRLFVMNLDLGNHFPTHRYSRSEKYKKFVRTVARLCPYIVRITAGVKAPSKSFYRDVLDLHQQGHLQHVQCLPDLGYTDVHESEMDYYRLVLAMKASLTRVSIDKNQFSKVFGGHQPETNVWWEHLKGLSQLEELDVSYKGEGFLYQAHAFIAKCIAPVVHIHAHLPGFGEPQLLPLDLVTTPPQPQVKHLDVDILCFTAKDLEYIMHTFTGLESFSVKKMQDQRNVPILIQSEGGDAGSLVHMCLKLFQFLVSLKRFKVSKLWFHALNIEIFSFWVKYPQLKALTISKCSKFEAEAAYMTVLSRDKEAGLNLIDFEDTKDGVYEMELALNHFNFSLYYSQILELFGGNTLEALCLRDIVATGPVDTESERRKSVGNSLGYVIDHYTSIKDIQVHQANCRTLNAHTAQKQLQRLTFKQCSIYPHVLQQLSRSVKRIQKLILHETIMAHADQQNHSFVIDMPQTIIDDLRVINYAARIYLVKLCVSEPSPVSRCLQIQADDVAYMEQNTYDAMCLTSKDHYDCIVLHINCKTIKTFGTSYDRCYSLISE